MLFHQTGMQRENAVSSFAFTSACIERKRITTCALLYKSRSSFCINRITDSGKENCNNVDAVVRRTALQFAQATKYKENEV